MSIVTAGRCSPAGAPDLSRFLSAILFLALSATAPSTAAAQAPPSQFELNGFLLNQPVELIEAALGNPFRVQQQPDGWHYRGYVLNRRLNAYMVFKIPPDPARAYSIQIAGRPGTEMHPFLGLRLGAPRSEVVRRLGEPSQVTPIPDLGLQLWEFTDRNYSVELDSLGRLSSIQIYGYQGLAQVPGTDGDPLARMRWALEHRDVDSLMAQVAPDLEAYQGDLVIKWSLSPRASLQDSTAPLTRILLDGDPSVRSLVLRGPPSDSAARLHENGPVALVYKYDAGPIEELVFGFWPGGYRLWEIHYR